MTGDDTSFIRGAALLGFPELVGELGGEPEPLLARARLPMGSVGSTEDFISYAGFAAVLEDAAMTLGRPDIGRLLARRQGLEVLGALGAVTTTAPTLGDGLALVRSYVSVFTPALESDLERGPDTSRFWFRTSITGVGPHPQAMELLLVRALRTMVDTVGDGFFPVSVLVPHAPLVPVADYRRDLGASIRFEQGVAGAVVRTGDLARTLDADAEVHRVVQEYIASYTRQPGDMTLQVAVRRMVERRLPSGAPTLEDVAGMLSLHPRTLQRHLAMEGTSLAALVEDMRRELVEEYLRDTRLELSRVATMLGYSQQSVLTRACRRWFGRTPSDVRRALRAGGPAVAVGHRHDR